MKLFNFLKRKTNNSGNLKARSVFSRIGRDPRVDWTLIVFVTFISTIIFIFIGLSKFSNIDSALKKKVSAVETKAAASIDTKSLDDVINKFDKRATERAELLRNYSGPADPSI